MPSAAKAAEFGRGPFRRSSDSEMLLFLARTLQPHFDSAELPSVFAKLQRLHDMLERQDETLADIPDCPGKDRMRQTLANAKDLAAQIVEDLAGAAAKSSGAAPAASP